MVVKRATIAESAAFDGDESPDANCVVSTFSWPSGLPESRGAQAYAFDWGRWSRTLGRGARVESLVLATPAVDPAPSGTAGVELVRHLVADPAYQLK